MSDTVEIPESKKVLFIIIVNRTTNGFLPGGSGTTVRHDTQK
jgi:hypothetical protein